MASIHHRSKGTGVGDTVEVDFPTRRRRRLVAASHHAHRTTAVPNEKEFCFRVRPSHHAGKMNRIAARRFIEPKLQYLFGQMKFPTRSGLRTTRKPGKRTKNCFA